MRYIFRDMPAIKRRLAGGFVLLLDFDLTLSPLAKDPGRAFLPKATKDVLRRLSARFPVIIVTGRSLRDIKRRVGLGTISYIGNHGLEHDLNGKHEAFPIPAPVRRALAEAKREIVRGCRPYSGIVFEDKARAFALGYRLVRGERVARLESVLAGIKRGLEERGMLEASLDNRTFEVRPSLNIDKGTACRLALKVVQGRSRRRLVPLYIGDARTDEDAFAALKGKGITVRVGKSGRSAARWYVRTQREVALFLRSIA